MRHAVTILFVLLCLLDIGRSRGAEKWSVGAHEKSVCHLSFSRDGRWIATCSGGENAKLWHAADGKLQATLADKDVLLVAWMPDGKSCVTGCFEGTKKLWVIATGKERETLEGQDTLEGDDRGISSLDVSPDGKLLASGGWKSVRIWNFETRRLSTLYADNKNEAAGENYYGYQVKFFPDGKALAAINQGEFAIYDLKTHKERVVRLESLPGGDSLVFTRNGSKFYTATSDREGPGKVCLWKTTVDPFPLWAPLWEHLVSDTGYVRMAVSPDETVFATIADFKLDFPDPTRGRSITLWDVATRRKIGTLEGHATPVVAIAFSPDGKSLASAERGDSKQRVVGLPNHTPATLKLWDLTEILKDRK